MHRASRVNTCKELYSYAVPLLTQAQTVLLSAAAGWAVRPFVEHDVG
jgi:hypothetical protein